MENEVLFYADIPFLSISLNAHYGYRVIKKGKYYIPSKYTSNESKQFVKDLRKFLKDNGLEKEKIKEECKLKVGIFFKTKAKADLDNRMKCLQDALMELEVIEDDSLIKELEVNYYGVQKGGRMLIKIERLTEEKKLEDF